jgi:ribosomal protein L31
VSHKQLRVSAFFLFAALALALSACGSAPAPSESPQQTWYVDAARFHQGAHGGLDCADCHTDIKLTDVPDKHPSADNIEKDARTLFDYKACDRCHPQEYAAYNKGVHADVRAGTREKKSTYDAPVCGNCHSPHYDPANRTRAELLTVQVDLCGACHPVERETYLQNIHGKAAVNLGETNSPGCTDCHGGHQVASLTKPEDALAVCQRCHPAATTNMAGFLIHAQENIPAPDARRATESTILFGAKIFFTLLIVGILGFFYAHTLLWLIRSAHRKMRGG